MNLRVKIAAKRLGSTIMIPRGVCNAAFFLGISVIAGSVGASAQERKEPGPAASEQQAFNNACRTCHMMKEGDNRLGPNLHKIIGRKAGSLPDYNYSSAMKEAGFVWDKEKLERFIANPDEVVPGNSMKPYSGLASSDDRTKILAFLAQSQ
jgi:cytochrome c